MSLPLFKQKLLLWCYYINMVMGVVYEEGVVTFLIFFYIIIVLSRSPMPVRKVSQTPL